MPRTLTGIAFAALALAGFFLLGGDGPEYGAPDRAWVEWASDRADGNRLALFASLLSGIAFLMFADAYRDDAMVYAGGVIGVVGLITAASLVTAAGFHGAESHPVVTRALFDAATPGYLLGSLGFAVHLGALGLTTRRSGTFARWAGYVALAGAAAFALTFLTVLDDSDDTPFGVGYPLGYLCLAIWTVSASVRLSGAATRSPDRPRPSNH